MKGNDAVLAQLSDVRKRYGKVRGARRRRPRPASGRGARAARRQRRRQVHRDRPAARPAVGRQRQRDLVRAATAVARRAPPHRRDAASRRHSRCQQGRRTARADAQLLPGAAQRRRLRGAGRARRLARSSLRPPVRRPAAARAVRAGGVRAAAAAVPRRAHHRPRHRGAPGAVARDPRAGRAGQLGAADHALPGGGRGAGRSRGRAQPRPRRRRRRDGARCARTWRSGASAACRRWMPQAVAGWPQVRSARRDGERLEVVVVDAAEAGGAAPARTRRRLARAGGPARRPGRGLHRTHPGRSSRMPPNAALQQEAA